MKKWIFFLVVGIALLSLSTGAAGEDGVRCDGALMSPGDVCEYTNRSGDVTSRQTYDEVEADTKAAHQTFVTWGRWALLGGGLALSVLGIWGIVRERRRRKAQGPSTADLYLQQQQQQAVPAGPGYAQPAHTPPPQFPPQYAPQQYQQQPTFPPRPPQAPPAPPAANPDFGPGSGDSGEDVTQRMR
jgi:hypothetical protein